MKYQTKKIVFTLHQNEFSSTKMIKAEYQFEDLSATNVSA